MVLALVAFAAAGSSPLLAYLIPPLRDALASDDLVPVLSARTVMSLIPLALYLLFTAVLTRRADHQPLRAAGLTLNRRAASALLAGTGLAVLITVCLAVVLYALGIGGAPGPRRPDLTAGGTPVWLVLILGAVASEGRLVAYRRWLLLFDVLSPILLFLGMIEIGRASCRERV